TPTKATPPIRRSTATDFWAARTRRRRRPRPRSPTCLIPRRPRRRASRWRSFAADKAARLHTTNKATRRKGTAGQRRRRQGRGRSPPAKLKGTSRARRLTEPRARMRVVGICHKGYEDAWPLQPPVGFWPDLAEQIDLRAALGGRVVTVPVGANGPESGACAGGASADGATGG